LQGGARRLLEAKTMHVWTPRSERPAVAGPPSPLLRRLTGEFAPRIAGLWPAPHTPFLTAPAERRHLACLALALVRDKPLPLSGEVLLCASLKEAIARAVPAAPNGMARALGRLGEDAWISSEYIALLGLLGSPLAGKSLRHAKAIVPALVVALGALPEPLILAGVGQRFAISLSQAELLAETWAVLEQSRGTEAARAEAVRWAGARSAAALFEAVSDSLKPEIPAPPFPGSARLVPLATKSAMREAAIRYRNCLRSYLNGATDGNSAFYEWVGPPGVVVQLDRDPLFGWRLEQARLRDNEAPPEPVREAINAELRSWGVHLGRSRWQLEHALGAAGRGRYAREDPNELMADIYGVV
jgi:hypothetical protein